MHRKGTEIYITENRCMSQKMRRGSSINAFIFKNILITCVRGSVSNLETSLDAFFALLCNFCMRLIKHWAPYPSKTLVLTFPPGRQDMCPQQVHALQTTSPGRMCTECTLWTF